MNKNNFLHTIKKDKIYTIVLLISLISLLRSLFLPLQADELTYLKIAENILNGKYFLNEHPSTITPVIPFILALFHTPFYPTIGFVLFKCLNITLTFFGFRFVYLFLKNQNIDLRINMAIIMLTIVNTNSVAWFSTLYPEAILFFSFWGFVYYYAKEMSIANFKKMFFFFILLFMARYLYAVLGLPVLYYYYRCLKNDKPNYFNLKKIIGYSFLYLIPVLFWFKYVYMIELNQITDISYFRRFQTESGFLSNIKYGLGIGIHPEVGKVNGIPAFITLFVPITGLRNYILSILLIFLFLIGYFKTKKSLGLKLLLSSTILVMLGLIFAGTGFSRYWLILLPSFYLGYYLLLNSFKLPNEWFVKIAKFVSIIYVINELRLDYLIFNKYL